MRNLLLSLFYLLFFLNNLSAQKITYATQGDVQTPEHGFDIIGKINEKYFIHISHFNTTPSTGNDYFLQTIRSSTINVYDKEMKLISQQDLPLPKKYFGVHFISCHDFIYMFYQYTTDNHIFCMALKIDSTGKMVDKPITCAETVEKDYFSTFPAYNIMWSENKNRIAIFTMQENEQNHKLSLIIYNEQLKAVKTEMYQITRTSAHESFSDFNIDNEGNFIFLKSDLFDVSDPYKYVLNVAKYNSSSISLFDITPHGIQLNSPTLKIDNSAKQVNFLSFYIDSSINAILKDVPFFKAEDRFGFFQVTWDIESHQLINAFATPFDNMTNIKELDANLVKLSIQDFIVGKIYPHLNKGLLLSGGYINMSHNLYSRYLTAWQNNAQSEREYLNYNNPNVSASSILSIKNSDINIQNDILLLSFDSTGKCEKFNFVNELKSFSTMSINTRNAIHYIFIHKEKNDYSLNHISYSDKGEIQQQPPIKDIKNYQFAFIIGYQQISDTELICPVLYNNKLNFAKIEF